VKRFIEQLLSAAVAFINAFFPGTSLDGRFA